MKWRRVRQENATSFEELSPTQTSQACDVVSDMDQRVCVGSDAAAFNTPVMMASATNLIEEVFENANNMPLPKAVWDKADVDGLRTIMFCEVFMISAAATQPDGSSTGANYYAAAPSCVVMKKSAES